MRIRLVKHYIDGTTDSLKYRMCGKMDKNVSYMLSECNELVQNEYKNELVQNEYKKTRHEKVAALLNWRWCKAHGFKTHEKYYEHFLEKKIKILEIDKGKSCGI